MSANDEPHPREPTRESMHGEQTHPTERIAEVSPSARRPPLPGDLLGGKFRLAKRLAEGGMCIVYLAEHEAIGRQVVVKIPAARYHGSPEHQARIIREARAASKIDNEHVVGIIDVGHSENGSPFIVMEHLRGEPLTDTIDRDAPLSIARIKRIGLQLCRALHASHSKGIIHRDMKPDNIFRIESETNLDFVKVLDFGLAKALADFSGQSSLTPDGIVMGSPAYMSPEQCKDEPLDARTDLYSVGVILYELTTGRLPFQASNTIALLNMHTYATPDPPSVAAPGVHVPAQLEELILRCLAKSPEKRFQTARELSEALAAVPTDDLATRESTPRVRRQSELSDDLRRQNIVIAVLVVQTAAIVVLLVTVLVLLWRVM